MIELKNFSLWMGKYGGCFIPDCFTPRVEETANKVAPILWRKDFSSEVYKLTSQFIDTNTNFVQIRKESPISNLNLFIIDTLFYTYYSSVGQFLISKKLGFKKIYTYATNKQHAISVAVSSNSFDNECEIILDQELSRDESLVEYLRYMGCKVETDVCNELFDIPAMYAFQKWLTHPFDSFFITEKANVGPYVFPQISLKLHEYATSYLLKEYLDTLNNLDFAIFPVVTGTLGSSIFSYIVGHNNSMRFYSIRKLSPIVRNVEFCGGLTVTFGEINSTKLKDIMNPYLVYLWDSQKIKDLQFSLEELEFGVKEGVKLKLTLDLVSSGTLYKGMEISKTLEQNSKGGIFVWRL